MTFFESLLLLLAIAILLLQVARRLALPYPAMLALAGVALALLPGMPTITLEPQTALALFIAPVLVDAAFDFPLGAVRKLWRPLFALAVVAVLLSAGAVAALGMLLAGLPFYAALAFGAIVAPPDAAAATAILNSVSMPRRSVTVLKGESLLNDASALFLFTAALSLHSENGISAGLALELGLAVPGGIVLGILFAKLTQLIRPFVAGTLGGNLLEFVGSFGVWVIAERLGLSAVLCLVAFAMTLARTAGLSTKPRMRIHSYAVWTSAVFLLNVLAFLLMGLQARTIIGNMEPGHLAEAAWFALAVLLCLVAVRMAWVLLYNGLARQFPSLRGDLEPANLREGLLVGWCGMRGLVTLAASFALPADFPQRDMIVLAAFGVVLGTLVLQGLTLAPLVRLLKLDGEDGLGDELLAVRADLASAALALIGNQRGPAADYWRYGYETAQAALSAGGDMRALDEKRTIGLAAIRHQRERLETLRAEDRVSADVFMVVQEELDFREVALSSEEDRQIEES